MINQYEERLTGGHPNSLGNTIEIVDEILKDESKLKDLYDCYQSDDEVVRLRVSSGMKRVCKEKPEWVAKYLDGLLNDISTIDQPSSRWTLAQLFMMLENDMDQRQTKKAVEIMKHNLETEDDWIVQNITMEALLKFSADDDKLKDWLVPMLVKNTKSKHGSVVKRAQKYLAEFK